MLHSLLLRLVSGDRAWFSVTDMEDPCSCDASTLLLVEVLPPTEDRDGVIADIEECRCMGLTAATVTVLHVERWTNALPDGV